MSIRIFITGGTFDKEYNELTGQLYFNDSHLPEMLDLGRNLVPVEVRTLMMVDSLEMTDVDRELIAEHCKKSKEDKIIITHGTDTMAETAKLLSQKIKDKTKYLFVVLQKKYEKKKCRDLSWYCWYISGIVCN